jgi:hypothetical protein
MPHHNLRLLLGDCYISARFPAPANIRFEDQLRDASAAGTDDRQPSSWTCRSI